MKKQRNHQNKNFDNNERENNSFLLIPFFRYKNVDYLCKTTLGIGWPYIDLGYDFENNSLKIMEMVLFY